MQNQSVNNNLFRQNALNHLNSLDEIDISLRVVHPGAWMWLVVSLAGLIGFLIWACYGSLNFQIETQGILLPRKAIAEAEIFVGKNLAEVFHSDRLLYANLFKFAFSDSLGNVEKDLEVLVFIHHAWGKRIKPRMNAYILPTSRSSINYGYIEGEVISVSDYPVTKEIAYSFLGNMNLVDDFFVQGAPFLAKIRLFKSRNKSKLFDLQPGTLVTGKITWQKCSPVTYVYNHADCG